MVGGRYEVTACALPKYDCVSRVVTVENPEFSEAKEVSFTLPLAKKQGTLYEDEVTISIPLKGFVFSID